MISFLFCVFAILNTISTSAAIPPSHVRPIHKAASLGANPPALYGQAARRSQHQTAAPTQITSSAGVFQTLESDVTSNQIDTWHGERFQSSSNRPAENVGSDGGIETGPSQLESLPTQSLTTVEEFGSFQTHTLSALRPLDGPPSGDLVTHTGAVTSTSSGDFDPTMRALMAAVQVAYTPPAHVDQLPVVAMASPFDTNDLNTKTLGEITAPTITQTKEALTIFSTLDTGIPGFALDFPDRTPLLPHYARGNQGFGPPELTTMKTGVSNYTVREALAQPTDRQFPPIAPVITKAHLKSINGESAQNFYDISRARGESVNRNQVKKKSAPLQGRKFLTSMAPAAHDFQWTEPAAPPLIETWHPPSGMPAVVGIPASSSSAGSNVVPVDNIAPTSQDGSGMGATSSVTVIPETSFSDAGALAFGQITTITRPLWDGGQETVTLCRRIYTEAPMYSRAVPGGRLFDADEDVLRRQMIQPVSTILQTGAIPETAPSKAAPRGSPRLNTSTSIVCSESTWAVLLVFMVLFPVGFTILMTELLIRHVWFRRVPADIKVKLLADKRYRSYERMCGAGAISLVCVLVGILVACYLRNGVCEDVRTCERAGREVVPPP